MTTAATTTRTATADKSAAFYGPWAVGHYSTLIVGVEVAA